MNCRPQPPRFNPGPPYVEVEKINGWTWALRMCHGISVYGPNGGPYIVHGSRKRADRIANRRLARYLREQQRRASSSHRVTT